MDAAAVLDLLASRAATLASAESLTGGMLAARITAVPGASRLYVGGVVGYSTEVKQELLGVPAALVERHGVVSPECARAMADGARRLLSATWALSTTGVAGPDLQEGRPVGTAFVGIAGPDLLTVVALELSGNREQIRERTCDEALAALGRILGEFSTGKNPASGSVGPTDG